LNFVLFIAFLVAEVQVFVEKERNFHISRNDRIGQQAAELGRQVLWINNVDLKFDQKHGIKISVTQLDAFTWPPVSFANRPSSAKRQSVSWMVITEIETLEEKNRTRQWTSIFTFSTTNPFFFARVMTSE
jgi:hypothetical protein